MVIMAFNSEGMIINRTRYFDRCSWWTLTTQWDGLFDWPNVQVVIETKNIDETNSKQRWDKPKINQESAKRQLKKKNKHYEANSYW